MAFDSVSDVTNQPSQRRLGIRQLLSALVVPWAELRSGGDGEVAGISLDSRLIAPDDLYVAMPGNRAHGASFAAGAVAAGASAVLTDAEGAALLPDDLRVPVAVAEDVRWAMARVAERLFGAPAHDLRMFGITGTNGKTTTVFLLAAALGGLGLHVGTIGTLGFQLDGEALPVARTTVTTPEAVDLHALLALMRDSGADAVAMEVSSHAMALQRTEPVRFDVSGFTNLSPEHLDFHDDMDDYFEAKAKLFSPDHTRAAVVCVDDPAAYASLSAFAPPTWSCGRWPGTRRPTIGSSASRGVGSRWTRREGGWNSTLGCRGTSTPPTPCWRWP